MRYWIFWALWLLSAFTASGCAFFHSRADLDRGQVNHPAMELDTPRTPALAYPLTGMDGARSKAGSGGCSACAK